MTAQNQSGIAQRQVFVIGAGIGGLATALSLHAVGIKCRVFESAAEIAELGVGINLLPHAVRELTELGLLDALCAEGIETAELRYFNRFGQQIWQEPRGRAAGYNWPQFSIHRGRLQWILLSAVLDRLGVDAVATDHHVSAVSDLPDGSLEVQFQSGATERAGAVIAADGIRSTIRGQLYPNEGMPIWNGAVMWRGIADSDPFLTGRSMFMAGNMLQKFVAYPISRRAHEAGGSQTNFIAELRFPAGELGERENWNKQVDIEQFMPEFADWQFDWLDVPQLIRSAPAVFEFPMVDRDPLPRWTHGNLTLLGDAAHPMYPIGSNGASQAILDARVLAQAMATHETPAAAFAAYEAERRPATAAIVKANRGNGPEQVMQLAHERAPDGFDDINSVIPLAERQAIADQYKQVAGFARDALNQRAARSGERS